MTSDASSLLRYAMDVILYRALFFVTIPTMNRERTIRVRSGLTITYRLNRGDILTVKEVIVNQCYRLPFAISPRVLVDLGANIGLTSLWYSRRYDPDMIIAVEPSPLNIPLLRKNLEANGVRVKVIEGAIGPVDGSAQFRLNRDHNMGSIGESGETTVAMLSMHTLIDAALSGETVDVVKMDIEGGEQQLLSCNREWLRQVRSLIVEFHPTLVDYPALLSILEGEGFHYVKRKTATWESMDSFIRDEAVRDLGARGA
jgi:FkbM family methyltransferase